MITVTGLNKLFILLFIKSKRLITSILAKCNTVLKHLESVLLCIFKDILGPLSYLMACEHPQDLGSV